MKKPNMKFSPLNPNAGFTTANFENILSHIIVKIGASGKDDHGDVSRSLEAKAHIPPVKPKLESPDTTQFGNDTTAPRLPD